MHGAQDLAKTAELFKALAAPSRLQILLILSQGPSSVTHLVEETGLSQPLVSQHLRMLRGIDLVRVDRHGRHADYSLSDDHVSHVIADALAHTQEGSSMRVIGEPGEAC